MEHGNALDMIPVFPLPRRVLFPGIPFHCALVEPQEVRMVRATIRDQKWLRVLPVHSSGSQVEVGDSAGIVCLARVRRVHFMPDGGLLMDLLGIARARVQAEVPRGKPYSCVEVQVLNAPFHEDPPAEGWLRQAYETIRSLRGQPSYQLDPYPAGLWLDLLCHFLPVPFDAKLQLFSEKCQLRRREMLASSGPYWKTNRLMNKYLPRLFHSN